MAWYDNLVERMTGFRLPVWEELPDLGLYMDQVMTFLERQYRPLYGDFARVLTPAMINNYVKSGLIQRPIKKKYEREQIAQLTMICALKQAVSLEDLRRLIKPTEAESIEARYRAFCLQLRQVTSDLHGVLEGLSPMRAAVCASGFVLLCGEILHGDEQETDPH